MLAFLLGLGALSLLMNQARSSSSEADDDESRAIDKEAKREIRETEQAKKAKAETHEKKSPASDGARDAATSAVNEYVADKKKSADKKKKSADKKKPAKKKPVKPSNAGKSVVLVLSIQRTLNHLGAAGLKEDGLTGPKTETAWTNAALGRKLNPVYRHVNAHHAQVATATAAELNREAAAKAAQAAPAHAAPPAPVHHAAPPVHHTAPPAPPVHHVAPPAPVQGHASTVVVLSLQRTLNHLGAGLREDGVIGPKTEAAWAKAAHDRQLDPSIQRVDAHHVHVATATANALNHEVAARNAAPAQVRPAPVHPAVPSPSAKPTYDYEKARAGARALSNHLARTGKPNYDHRLLKQWQTWAGLTVDGAYGGRTRGALIYYGVKDPPHPFSPPAETIHYVPPGTA